MSHRRQKKQSNKASVSSKPVKPAFGRAQWGAAAALVAITVLTYLPVGHYGFVNYDDPAYIYQNPPVTHGLTLQGLSWAFTTGHQANWHPLTWLSHMADVQLYGLNAGPHHVMNLLLHAASTFLLFWLLLRMTGTVSASMVVAALFAVHPLHVESVAWIAERKDVLSTFFWMLTMTTYVLYVQRPRLDRYLAMIAAFGLGLMAKPMLVTLPFVLLLLDFWPLQRWTLESWSNLGRLIREKIPLLLLATASSIVTVIAQRKGGALVEINTIPIGTRVANAFVVSLAYLGKMFWPTRLGVLYPAVTTAPDGWFAAVAGVIGLSVLAGWMARRRPYVAVGWFWYIGTLVPVIGLVQVGRQAMADRYTYVTLIGIFIALAFGANEILKSQRYGTLTFMTGSALLVVLCMWMTRTQLRYWTGSRALWEHTLDITSNNSTAHFNLGAAVENEGRVDEAIFHYREALRIEPDYADAHFNLGNALTKNGGPGRMDEAMQHLVEALRLRSNFAEAQEGIGIHYLLQGNAQEAISHLTEAIRLKPSLATAHNNLATAFGSQGRVDDALRELNEAIKIDPGYSDAHSNLGILLASQGRTHDAIAHLTEALRIDAGNQTARAWLSQLTGTSVQ
jgi:Tfp pilus assembly protein PilF